MKLSVLIPVYNEKDTITELLDRVTRVPVGMEKEIIVIDDGSTDGTRDVLRNLDPGNSIIVIMQEKNRGKGAALKVGIARAGGDFVIFQDADLEYDPADYPALLAPLQAGTAELVIGSRVLSGSMRLFGPHRVHLVTYVGCKLIAFLINVLYGYSYTDYYGCYKAFRRELLTSIPVEADGFEYDSELLCKLLKRRVCTAEVPTAYYPRSHHEGKKLSFWSDGLAVVYSILKWRFID